MTSTGTGENLRASIIICTLNRARSLARTLESIVEAGCAVSRPWELLVVDNGSTDATPDIIRSFADRLPIRSVLQPVAGLSNARNAGVAAAAGQYIIWTDDDVLVDRNWLAAYFAAFDRFPDCAIFGGRAVPQYEAPQQRWFIAAEPVLKSLLAIRDTPEWSTLTLDRLPFGLNYAVRAAEQRQFLYDPELGVAPGRRRGGEETAVLRALLKSGATGRWVWEAKVNHLIPAARQSVKYILEYYAALAEDNPLPLPEAAKLEQGAYPFTLHARLAYWWLRTWSLRLIGNRRWVGSLAQYARLTGTIRHLRPKLQ